MENSIIEVLRDIIGEPEFYVKLGNQTNYTWDYGAMVEYMIAGIVVCICVASVFKFILNLIK